MQPQPLPWCNPLDLAAAYPAGPMALLYSSAQTGYSGGVSVLAVEVVESVDVATFDALARLLKNDVPRFCHAWFGYFSYEMKHDAEHYSNAPQGRYTLPRGRFTRFAKVYVFDHAAKKLSLFISPPACGGTKGGDGAAYSTPVSDAHPSPPPQAGERIVRSLRSNMTRAEYEQKVAHILEEITAGNLYQANLTRKFYGEWETKPDGFSLFAKLCDVSPAPYSAYLRFDEAEILSSSPEMFLRVSPDHRGLTLTEQGEARSGWVWGKEPQQKYKVETRPIKGSAPRGHDAASDKKSRDMLAASDKNRAENLMITDLMRSDLSRVCTPGSVRVEGLFDVTTHATIHHMASTVSGELAAGIPELLRATLPPGSMTGAPKIRAVELCNALEGVERGVYSGAIGWLGGDGSAELSVVIRTLILHANQFEFQVGGGIVADSTPEGEWQETMDKILGILKTLGISRNIAEAL